MKRLMKGLGRGEKGFTLIELLIVIAILGIIAAVAVPNVGGFMTSGRLNAANTEVQNVKTAALAFYAENNTTWPADGAALTSATPPYLQGTLTGVYAFNAVTGLIDTATNWTGLQWNATTQVWEKAP